jgi:hypothetical protein
MPDPMSDMPMTPEAVIPARAIAGVRLDRDVAPATPPYRIGPA